jgi:hypothetical protein
LKSEIKDLEKRVNDLDAKKAEQREGELYKRLIAGLTYDEQIVLARLIRTAENESAKVDEAWLSRRPQDQQQVAKKVMAEFKRFLRKP